MHADLIIVLDNGLLLKKELIKTFINGGFYKKVSRETARKC